MRPQKIITQENINQGQQNEGLATQSQTTFNMHNEDHHPSMDGTFDVHMNQSIRAKDLESSKPLSLVGSADRVLKVNSAGSGNKVGKVSSGSSKLNKVSSGSGKLSELNVYIEDEKDDEIQVQEYEYDEYPNSLNFDLVFEDTGIVREPGTIWGLIDYKDERDLRATQLAANPLVTVKQHSMSEARG